MDKFLLFFVRQKKLALAFTVLVITVGVVTLLNIQRDQFPAVDFEVMVINTAYPGASPEDVEQNVTNPIEDELKNISGIDKFTSVSREGVSNIIVTLSPDVSDISALKQDIRNAVNRVKSFPEEVEDLPFVIDEKTSERSVLKISIGGNDIPYGELRRITDEIEDELALVEGVSDVVKEGYRAREIQIHIDPQKLNQYQLSLPQVLDRIASRNKRYTVGNNNNETDEKNIVVLAKFDRFESVADVVLKSTFDGPIVRLRDIAKISDSTEDEKSIIRVNGTKGFVLRVKKREKADVIKTVDRVKEKIVELTPRYPPSLNIFYSQDLTKFVKNRLNIVTNNGLIGLGLVLIVLGLFLSLKTAFWVSLSLPVSLLGAVALLGFFGETINLVSLAAMILVLGIVVDDSIIVAESIYHYKQLGEGDYRSTVHGFKRVIMPVITTIITTIMAFSSMFLMGGTMGKFIYVIPLVVIFALTLSFLEVSLALPAHLAHVNEKVKTRTWFSPIEDWFEKFAARALRWRYLVVVIFIAIFGVSIYFAATQMRFTLFPEVSADSIRGRLEMPPGSALQNTEAASAEVESLIIDVVGENLESVTNTVGKYFTHVAHFEIRLTPSGSRKTSARTLLDTLRERGKAIQGVEQLKFSIRRPGPPQGEDIEINLVGDDHPKRQQAADALEAILNEMEGTSSIERDDEPGKTRLDVQLDYAQMARLNVDFSAVNRYLKATFSGIDITDVRYGSEDVDFRIYLGDGTQDEHFINQIKIANRSGHLVPLSQFSTVVEITGEPDLNHFNGERSTEISASVDEKVSTPLRTLSEALSKLNLANNYPGIRAISEGGAEDTKESITDFRNAFLMSVLGIFLLLVLLFNSYTQPLIVISAIPFSAVGVIWAFFFHGDNLSFFAILGTLALVGVIINDSLVMVSHLNHLREKFAGKMPIYQWVAKGSRDRLRAVVLTTLTTLAGVIPLAYGIGGSDFILQPMALALGYGLFFGTLMTLILLPCMYVMNHEIVAWFARMVGRPLGLRLTRKSNRPA